MDGAFVQSSKKSTYGGVIRNYMGGCIIAFIAFIGDGSDLGTELLGIYNGLQVGWTRILRTSSWNQIISLMSTC